MNKFKAFRIHTDEQGKAVVRAGFEEIGIEDLTPGEVVVRVAYSCVNYKDALAATGKGKILRASPLVGGIDLSGNVVESKDPAFKEGDEVLVCGAGLSENYDGGYAEYARVKSDSIVRLPKGLSLRDAMAVGTAGFTAALAVQRLEDNGQQRDNGPILVTGATGGVGGFSVNMLSGIGYEVAALTRKQERKDYLRGIGAASVVLMDELQIGTRPLEKAVWAGAVDSIGGDVLSWLTRTVRPFGSIASIGLAGGTKLETTVMPFILRGVSILGVNSVLCSRETRDNAWHRIATDLKPRDLDKIVTREIGFDRLPDVFEGFMKGESVGRIIVNISG
ncbi:MAG: acryloyl-CoA reductase [Deltaproteobacteria bacterium]|nr:acryloyl-CoA reductase [Deltaproteobacteria bacterium]